MSSSDEEKTATAPEVPPTSVDIAQIRELHEYALKTLESLVKQQEEIHTQIERQIGLVSGFELLLGGKAEETLRQVREAISNVSQNGVSNGKDLSAGHSQSPTNGVAPH